MFLGVDDSLGLIWFPHAKVEDSLLSLEHCDLEVCCVLWWLREFNQKGMVINPIVGVYIPIIRIPIKGGMTIPNIATFDHGTFEKCVPTKSW